MQLFNSSRSGVGVGFGGDGGGVGGGGSGVAAADIAAVACSPIDRCIKSMENRFYAAAIKCLRYLFGTIVFMQQSIVSESFFGQ